VEYSLARVLYYLILVTAELSASVVLARAQAKADLEYRDRGRYSEGVKPKPVSAYDIELISALVNHNEAADLLPDQLKLSFYLPEQVAVNFVVRELENRLFYWLDNVKPPAAGWHSGGQNELDWPTATVLRRLQGPMNMYALGAVIRLGKKTPASVEDVAPAIL
jgi:hypothetical protein